MLKAFLTSFFFFSSSSFALVLGRTKYVLPPSGLLYEMFMQARCIGVVPPVQGVLCATMQGKSCSFFLMNMRLHGMVFWPSAFRRQSSHLSGLRNRGDMHGVQAFCSPTTITTSLRASTLRRHAWSSGVLLPDDNHHISRSFDIAETCLVSRHCSFQDQATQLSNTKRFDDHQR